MNNNLLLQYDELLPKLERLAQVLAEEIRNLLLHRQISVHSIQARVKSRESLVNKFNRLGDEISNVTDVGDLVGLRIVTYFAEELDEVRQSLGADLPISASHVNGTHARHVRLEVVDSGALPSFLNEFIGLNAEIQIRSLVQQTWTELEHIFGYKQESVPPELWGRFTSLPQTIESILSEFRRALVLRNVSGRLESIDASIRQIEPWSFARQRFLKLEQEFSSLLDSSSRESELQDFLDRHPEFLYPEYLESHPQFRLGDAYVPDYVLSIQGYQGVRYVFIEIERPDKLIFTKSGQFSAQFTQAKDQLLNWESWLTKNHDYICGQLPDYYRPQFHLVMGRDANVSIEGREKLQNEFDGTVRRFSTYDDLLRHFRAITERLFSI